MEQLEMENGRETEKQKTAEAKDTPWSRFQVDKVAEESSESSYIHIKINVHIFLRCVT